MKSIFLLCTVIGAAADAPNCQADENTLLQGLNTVRKVKKNTAESKDAKAMLKEMREIANSFVEGSDSTMSEDGLQDALDTAHAHFLEIREAILRQVANAQQQMTDASGGFRACTTKELAGLRQSVGQHAAAVESCQSTSAQLQAAERQQCATAEDCLCDEARVRTTDQEALCTAVTETYEAVFCEQHHMCASSQECHSSQAEVYQRLTTDVQGEIGLIREEYTATEQGICINRLTRQYQTGRRPTVIPRRLLDACDDVDVSALNINYPAAPVPPTCPAHRHGDPGCVAGVATLHWNGGSLRIPEGFDGCLNRDTTVDGQRGYPNDALTAITGLKNGCAIQIFGAQPPQCGGRRRRPREASLRITEDSMDLTAARGVGGLIVSCAAR